MIVFPNCKINLGLHITGKREDGYHNIETIFYPVALTDVLEIIHADPHKHSPGVLFTQSGITIDGDVKDNLCVKAWHLLKQDFPELPAIQLHLHKAIPLGAGLGGGSADASFALLALNEKYNLQLSTPRLLSYAFQLGSDCPFFILNQPSLATGRGEILQPVTVSLSGYRLVLVNPGIHINTGRAFSQLNLPESPTITAHLDAEKIQSVLLQPLTYWKDYLVNDFEIPVFKQYPEVGAIKQSLYDAGALFALMSGSGSSVYGIFPGNIDFQHQFPSNYLLRNILL